MLVKNTNEKSQKIELFLDLVESILSEGEKVVVFSKYRSLQNILDMHLENRFKGIKICHINGMMDSEKRFEQVRLFNETNDYNIIIASNAGSEGINMHSAKYLIEMDIADSYLIQTQRHGRIERASSKHDSVFVYQLIAIGSYDEIALKVVDKNIIRTLLGRSYNNGRLGNSINRRERNIRFPYRSISKIFR